MKTYLVKVLVHTIGYYQIKAESAEEALENWHEGAFVGTDDAALESEPVEAVKKGHDNITATSAGSI